MQSKNPVMNWWHYCQGTFTNCNECNYKQWKILMIQKSVLILTEYSSRFSNCKCLFEFMPREMENRSIFMVTPQCIHLFKTVLHMLNYMWRTILRIYCRFLSPVLRGWQTVSEAEGKNVNIFWDVPNSPSTAHSVLFLKAQALPSELIIRHRTGPALCSSARHWCPQHTPVMRNGVMNPTVFWGMLPFK